MRVANRALGELPALHRDGQALGGDLVGRFVGVEGQRHDQLAIGHHLAHSSRVLWKLFAPTPKMRVQCIQKTPQRSSLYSQSSGRDRQGQGFHIQGVFDQGLLDEGGAMKVWRARVGNAPGLLSGQCQQFTHALWRFREALGIGKKCELGHAPR